MITDAANANQFAAELIIEELVRLGVTTFFVSPGSRSSPLLIAAGRHPTTRCVVHFDERGTAFAALGYGRARETPAVWITTSGTAVANGLPAVVEASADGVPLLAITADRPPELRKTDSNQTIDQPGIFGRHIRWDFDMPPWTPDVDPCYLLSTIDHAVHRSVADRGPVHINMMFREPLVPCVDRSFELPAFPAAYRWLERSGPFTTYDIPTADASEESIDALSEAFETGEPGLVIAGRLRSPQEGQAVASLAEYLGWPLFPDVLSFARHSVASVPQYDALLATDEFSKTLRPRVILHFGGRGTSKRVYEHAARYPPERFLLVSPMRERIDPVHRVTHRIEGEVGVVCKQISARLTGVPRQDESNRGRQPVRLLQDRVEAVLNERLNASADLTEPWIARHVSRHLPGSHELFLGSSMPIRDVDTFAGSTRMLPVRANRGASGIDGTVASAVGVSIGRSGPVTVLLGDLALLHDLNSLALLRSTDHPVVVIVINNDGGGIFSFLPVVDHADVFEAYFGTPHGLRFESAAEMFGLTYRAPDSTTSFAGAYRELCSAGISGLIEIHTDRQDNRRFHQELMKAISEVVEETLDSEPSPSARS